jgi:cysteine desulfurase family protein (TIGR01976 family)
MSVEPRSPALPALDIDFVRAQFPAFSHPEVGDWVHFENAGGSYVPRQVIDLLTHFYTATKVQPYGLAGPSRAAGEAMDRARELLPATFNAAADETHIGPSTSQNTYVLARAIRPALSIGDEVVVTNQDHEANIGSWRRMADTGLVIREWSVNSDSGLLDLADLESQLTDRTKLVCVTHASNLAATINPIRQIADLVHSYGALLLVDGVSWAPHDAIDVQALGCDFYLYSTYKTYGPHLGLMYVRREVLDNLANQGHYFNESNPIARLTPAGPDHAAVGAAAGIVDYYEDLYRHHFGSANDGAGDQTPGQTLAQRIGAVYQLVARHEEDLMVPLFDFLATKEVKIVGSADPSRAVRAPTIAFTSARSTPAEVAEALAAAQVGVGSGDFYARRLANALHLPDGVVRLSMVHYNTIDEVTRATEALDAVL